MLSICSSVCLSHRRQHDLTQTHTHTHSFNEVWQPKDWIGCRRRRFWHATLRLRSAMRRHHPPPRAVLSQICCFGDLYNRFKTMLQNYRITKCNVLCNKAMHGFGKRYRIFLGYTGTVTLRRQQVMETIVNVKHQTRPLAASLCSAACSCLQ